MIFLASGIGCQVNTSYPIPQTSYPFSSLRPQALHPNAHFIRSGFRLSSLRSKGLNRVRRRRPDCLKADCSQGNHNRHNSRDCKNPY